MRLFWIRCPVDFYTIPHVDVYLCTKKDLGTKCILDLLPS